jgi:hypothetical protein
MSLGYIGTKISGLRRLVSSVYRIKSEHRIGYWTLLRGFLQFRGALGIQRAEFISCGLWDTRRSLASRLATLSQRDSRVLAPMMNPATPGRLVHDKVTATGMLVDAGLPVAPVIAIASLTENVANSSDRFIHIQGATALRELLADAPANGLVFKPTMGGGGRSVHVFRSATSDRLVHFDGTVWPFERLLEEMTREESWKIEARLVQHPTLTRIVGESVGTLRLTTFRMKDGTVHLTLPVWKIPIGNSGLDHFSHGQGAPAAPIDPETGRIGPARYRRRLDIVERHPITGIDFVDTVMPYWQEAFELSRNVAKCFPGSASLGSDIAITPEGPVVIEINLNWAVNVH